MNLLIFTADISARVTYIFSTLLTALGITDFSFTTDQTVFENFSEAKINYSSRVITKTEVWIQPTPLLFESEIKEQQVICFDFNGSKAFYKTSDGDFPFDIFGASFY